MVEEKNMDITRTDLVEMGNEWMKMQFATGEDHFGRLFSEVKLQDYLTLIFLKNRMNLGESRIYLKEISESMEMPMHRVSTLVQHMQEYGYVKWTRDVQKNAGTYIELNQKGEEMIKKQGDRIGDFFEETITEYGCEKFIQLMKLRKEFNDVMDKHLSAKDAEE